VTTAELRARRSNDAVGYLCVMRASAGRIAAIPIRQGPIIRYGTARMITSRYLGGNSFIITPPSPIWVTSVAPVGLRAVPPAAPWPRSTAASGPPAWCRCLGKHGHGGLRSRVTCGGCSGKCSRSPGRGWPRAGPGVLVACAPGWYEPGPIGPSPAAANRGPDRDAASAVAILCIAAGRAGAARHTAAVRIRASPSR
jgi:hypothetical protein